MTQSKSTKRALMSSILAMLVCVAMLIGSTFAWFTDSVTSTGNIIKSGTLDVEMKWADGTESLDSADWKDASKGAIFDYDLWEPGYTEVRHVKISNVGSLALKYEVRIAATGEVSELADVIDVYYIKNGAQITDRTQLNDANKIGTLAQVLANPYAAKGNLFGKKGETVDSDIATIALKMQESAGNEYQDLSIGSEFAVVIVATQDTVENDSFDNQYDAGATFGETIEVGNDATSLEEAMNTPFVPVEINVTENISNGGTLEVTGDVTMNLGKNMIHNSTSAITGADIDVKDGGKLTINAEANSYGFDYTAGKLAASGNGSALTVNGGRYGDSGSGNSDVTAENGAAVTINSGRFSTSGYQGHAVMATSGGTMYINGGSYSSSGAQSVAIYADGGTIYVEGFDSLTANGRKFGVANDGVIYISKTASPSKPTSIASGCTVTEEDNYWVISAE